MTIPPSLVPSPDSPAAPTSDERSTAMLIHICLLLHTVGLIVALVLWTQRKEKSPFIDHHGKQALAFFIASLVVGIVVVVLIFFCVGIFLFPFYLLAHVLFPILAALAANRGEWYKYPLVGDFIK